MNLISYVDIGDPSYLCEYCGTYMWHEERIGKNIKTSHPKFFLCCVVLEMCYLEHVINVKMWNMILWINPWDKWCYAMSGKMMRIVLSWTYYTYIILYICVCVCVYAFVYLRLFRNNITHSLGAFVFRYRDDFEPFVRGSRWLGGWL